MRSPITAHLHCQWHGGGVEGEGEAVAGHRSEGEEGHGQQEEEAERIEQPPLPARGPEVALWRGGGRGEEVEGGEGEEGEVIHNCMI